MKLISVAHDILVALAGSLQERISQGCVQILLINVHLHVAGICRYVCNVISTSSPHHSMPILVLRRLLNSERHKTLSLGTHSRIVCATSHLWLVSLDQLINDFLIRRSGSFHILRIVLRPQLLQL